MAYSNPIPNPDFGAYIVTGASRGIGAATARRLAARGAPVCINYQHSADEAEAVATAIRDAGGKAIAVQASMESEADIVRLFERSAAAFGRLAGLVNNAGYVGQAGRSVKDADAEVLRRTFAVNVIAPMLCTREAIRRLSTEYGGQGGRIVNVSSVSSRLGGAGEWVDYSASKAALNTFTLGAARENAKCGIRINAVAPGVVDTRLHADAGEEGRAARVARSVPLGRAGEADEIACLVEWLLLDAPDYITGSVYDMAGGL